MPSKLYSAAKLGMQTKTVRIETDTSKGLHAFGIVGLADKAVEESKERISSALKNNGFKPPRAFSRRVIVNLAPADVKKEGGLYDLGIALGFLIDSEQIYPQNDLNKTIIVGELGLDGRLRPVRGVILYSMHAVKNGFKNIIVPQANQKEAKLIKNITVIAPQNIKELVEFLEDRGHIKSHSVINTTQKTTKKYTYNKAKYDFSLVKGQQKAKQALEIAMAGGHNVLFQGPPGSGKSLLAKTAVTILPEMQYNEALEVTKIESVCGELPQQNPLITSRPFRSPHHASSESAIVGGGAGLQPGEITRAHRGVLFLDEFPEFHRDVLESLRQPMEEGSITIARAKGVVSYPAKFMLIAAANPCPCGYFGDTKRECKCTTASIIKYQKKLSGPIADRIDIHVNVPRQPFKKITSDDLAEASSEIRKRVELARAIQATRFKNEFIHTNTEMGLRELKKYCKISNELKNYIGVAIEKHKLSARAYNSILKVSRTVADLAQSYNIEERHIAQALHYIKKDAEIV